MRKLVLALCAVLVLGIGVPAASADTIGLFDWTFNLNGVTYNPPALPGNFNTTSFDFSTGLGVILVTFDSPDVYSLIGYFDHDITGLNNPYNNEFGFAVGAPGGGQSWEIDEPGYTVGDLVPNVLAGTLDGMILNGAGSGPEDIAMAIGWNFTLAPNYIASLGFRVGTTPPPPGFYLNLHDPLPAGTPGQDIYYSSALDIRERGGPVIPEPGTLLLLGTGLAGVVRFARRKNRNK